MCPKNRYPLRRSVSHQARLHRRVHCVVLGILLTGARLTVAVTEDKATTGDAEEGVGAYHHSASDVSAYRAIVDGVGTHSQNGLEMAARAFGLTHQTAKRPALETVRFVLSEFVYVLTHDDPVYGVFC